MASATIYKTYSKAFFNFANVKNSLDNVYEDALLIEKTIKNYPVLSNFIKQHFINSEKKIAVLKEIFNNISPETKKFLEILNENGRLTYISPILENFISLYYKVKNIVKVNITLATEINDTYIKALEKEISNALKGQVIPTMHINKSIIGGFIISFNSQTYDASIAGKLKLLKSQFLDNS